MLNARAARDGIQTIHSQQLEKYATRTLSTRIADADVAAQRAEGFQIRLTAWTREVVEAEDLEIGSMLEQRACDDRSSEAADSSEEDFHVVMGFLANRF